MSGEELPKGWAEVRIADVCTVNPRDEHLDDAVEVTFVPMAAVSEVTGTIERPEVRKTQDVRKGFTSFVDEDVIFAKITPCMENGKSAVARGLLNGRGYGSTEFVVLRSKGSINPSFLHRFVRQNAYRREARGTMQSGVGQARVPKEFIENTTLMLPPLPEQKRIVARLDALQARSRAAREALAEVPALLDTLRQSLLAAAFRGDLTAEWRAKNPDVEPAAKLLERTRKAHSEWWVSTGRKKKWEPAKPLYASEPSLPELPLGWVWASSAEIVRPGTIITYGIVLPGAHVPGGVPYVRGGDIENGQILVDQLLRTAPEIAATKPDSALEPDDVLLCIIRHLKVAVVPPALRGANLTQGTVRLRCSEAVSSGYLANYLASPFAQEWMKAKHFGLAMPRINVEDAREVPIPIPPKAEQVEIAAVLATAMEKLRALERVALQHADDLDTLDQSILARAFRGELVDQDPNDEPAEVLLARIRSEGDAPASRGRARRSG